MRKSLPLAGARLWRPEEGGFHITLRALGECTPGQLAKIKFEDLVNGDVGRPALRPFAIHPTGIDAFEGDERPRVVHVAMEGGETDSLRWMREYVDGLAVGAGFPPEYSFTPHVTLGRYSEVLEPALSKAVTEAEIECLRISGLGPAMPMAVDGAAIMQSICTEQGVRYLIRDRGRLQ